MVHVCNFGFRSVTWFEKWFRKTERISREKILPRHSGDYKGTFTWEIAEGQVTPADEPGVLEV